MNTISQKTGIILMCLLFLVAACTSDNVVPKMDYSTKIVGDWEGTVNGMDETMTLNKNGTFECQLQPMGFISTTLSQGEKGSVSGTWTIKDTVITLTITGERNEHLKNTATYSTIKTFRKNKLVLISDQGDTTVFKRLKTFHLRKAK